MSRLLTNVSSWSQKNRLVSIATSAFRLMFVMQWWINSEILMMWTLILLLTVWSKYLTTFLKFWLKKSWNVFNAWALLIEWTRTETSCAYPISANDFWVIKNARFGFRKKKSVYSEYLQIQNVINRSWQNLSLMRNSFNSRLNRFSSIISSSRMTILVVRQKRSHFVSFCINFSYKISHCWNTRWTDSTVMKIIFVTFSMSFETVCETLYISD